MLNRQQNVVGKALTLNDPAMYFIVNKEVTKKVAGYVRAPNGMARELPRILVTKWLSGRESGELHTRLNPDGRVCGSH